MAPGTVRRGPGSVLPVPSPGHGGGAISFGARPAAVPAPPLRQERRVAEKTRGQRRAAALVPTKARVLRKADEREADREVCARRAVHGNLRGPAGPVFSLDAARVYRSSPLRDVGRSR